MLSYQIITFLTFGSLASCFYYPGVPTGQQIQLQVNLTDGSSAYLQLNYPAFTTTTDITQATIFTLGDDTALYIPDPDHPDEAPNGWNVVTTAAYYPGYAYILNGDIDYEGGIVTCTGTLDNLNCLPLVTERQSGPTSPDLWQFCSGNLFAYDPNQYNPDCSADVSMWAAISYVEPQTSDPTSSSPSDTTFITSSVGISTADSSPSDTTLITSSVGIATTASSPSDTSTTGSSTVSAALSVLTLPALSLSLPALPSLSLPTLPSLSLPTLPSLSVPTLPSLSVPTLPSLSLPTLPSLSVPTLPSLSVPTLPPLSVLTLPTLSAVKTATATTTTSSVATASAVPATVAEQLQALEKQIAALLRSFIKKPTKAVATEIKKLQTELAEIIVQQWF